jgi:hypothetical protein
MHHWLSHEHDPTLKCDLQLQGLLVYGLEGRQIYKRNLDQEVCREVSNCFYFLCFETNNVDSNNSIMKITAHLKSTYRLLCIQY